jgi:glucose/arabinose dehydrogenase
MFLTAAAGAPRPAHAINVPPGFVVDNVVHGSTFDLPVAVAFLPDGRFLVAEKRGRVYVVENGVKHPTPLWESEDEVLNLDDRGLLSIAADPNFAANRHVYFLYSVDPDSNGVDDDSDGFGRLTRYTVAPGEPLAVDAASRTILMGVDWPSGPLTASPSHTIGHLRFGADGSLLVSIGDGAHFTEADSGGIDPPAFGPGRTDPLEDIGAFRSQNIASLCGTVLRINPATGHGYAGNPYVDDDLTSVASRVWAYGFRNPFRFEIRPGTGDPDTSLADPGVLYVSDVGWDEYEEINLVSGPGGNYGWPCREGPAEKSAYRDLQPIHSDCSTVGVTPTNPTGTTDPLVYWSHHFPAQSFPPGVKGSTAIAGSFYQGALYPPVYNGLFFYGEFTQGYMRVLEVDSGNAVVSATTFADAADGPVHFTTDPANGDVLYVSIIAQEVRRFRYTGAVGGNTPPVAVGVALPDAGARPLGVQFDGTGSFDPDSEPLSYQWQFDDGTGSTLANPAHVYATPGLYSAVLTVRDAAGAMGLDTILVAVSESTVFPTTPVVDDFDRPDGPVGGAWVGDVGSLGIDANRLRPLTGGLSVTWDGAVFGPNQEAYVTIGPLAPGAPEHDLMLKVQGLSGSNGHIEVRYDDNADYVAVGTYTPGPGWQGEFTIPVTLVTGDQLGARAYENGTVQVYRNGALLGSTDVSYWPFHANGGRIGLTLVGAANSRLDDFGGGDVVFDSNAEPVATILEPAAGTFYAAGDTIVLHGTAVDEEDGAEAMTYRFDIDLHHNVHVHPSTQVFMDTVAFFIAENHDDGTGVHYGVRFRATDTGGKSGLASLMLLPEIDLTAGAPVWDRPQVGTEDTVTVQFRLHNRGAMPAPVFRWALVGDGTLLAEGDTLIGGRDSVTVTRTLFPAFAAGARVIRIMADTLGAVPETTEVNNAFTETLNVVEGSGTVDVPGALPATLALGLAYPNPARGTVGLDLALPAAADVRFSVHDIQGREVWRAADARLQAGRAVLTWGGVTTDGAPVRPGLYLARVRAGTTGWVRRFVMLR